MHGTVDKPPADQSSETQYALHVIDFNMRNALAHLQAIGACNRRTRKLNDDEFDYNQFNIENGDGGIY